MNLADPVLILDCQTTGANPRDSYLIELGWMMASAAGNSENKNLEEIEISLLDELGSGSTGSPVHSLLVALPDGEELPGRIQKITGITAADMDAAVAPKMVLSTLKSGLPGKQFPTLAVAHYARFEKAFLEDFFAAQRYKKLPFKFVCTCEIAKRLYPDLPSRAIRALVGYFGLTIGEMKRSACHVRATYHIWRRIVRDLASLGVKTEEDLDAFLAQPLPKKAAGSYELPMEKLKRLDLPTKPGIYQMLSRSGEILYVGKATSLRDRVNSYFRGRKGKDSKTKELISQIYDIRTEVVETPLEAALRETDLIKLHNPPYNRALREKGRHISFYSYDFSECSREQNDVTFIGPFPSDSLKPLLDLSRCLQESTFDPALFWGLVEPEIGISALESFKEICAIDSSHSKVRSLLALGMTMLRAELKAAREAAAAGNSIEIEAESEAESEIEESLDDEDDDELEEIGVDEAVEMLCGILVRSARMLRQARQLTALLSTEVVFEEKGKRRILRFKHGRLIVAEAAGSKTDPETHFHQNPAFEGRLPWLGLEIDTYDRMRVLATEMTRLARRAKVNLG